MNSKLTEFSTPQVLLRAPCLGDAGEIFNNYAGDPEVTRLVCWPTHKRLDDTKEFLRTTGPKWESGEILAWGLYEKDSGHNRCIGMVSIQPQAPRAELGYVLSRKFWNRGIMTDVLTHVVEFGLGLDDIHRIYALCHVDNKASLRVLEKAGMQREGVLRKWAFFPNLSGDPQDCFIYSKISGEPKG